MFGWRLRSWWGWGMGGIWFNERSRLVLRSFGQEAGGPPWRVNSGRRGVGEGRDDFMGTSFYFHKGVSGWARNWE